MTDVDSFHGHSVANQLFDAASMETFRSSHEDNEHHPRGALQTRLEKEERRQRKERERTRLHKEAKARLQDELLQHETIQSQLHTTRDSVARRRKYADKAEEEIREISLSLSSGAIRDEQLSVQLAKLQVELSAYQAKMEGVEEELQRAKDMIEEFTEERDKSKEEVRQMREERREALEERRMEAARQEGIMQGKLEGMYAGWEDGKVRGYKEGRRDGADHQHEQMKDKEWRRLKNEFSNVEDFDEHIPSPTGSFKGPVPDKLRKLEAPVIPPPKLTPKKPRREAPPPVIVHQESVRSSPETVNNYLPVFHSPPTAHVQPPPPPTAHVRPPPPPPPHVAPSAPAYSRASRTSHAPVPARAPVPVQPESISISPVRPPSTSYSYPDMTPQQKRKSAIPPPRPVFETEQSDWQPSPTPSQNLRRQSTLQKLGEKLARKPEEVSHAPDYMDFAPMAASLPYPSVTTPLPPSRVQQPGRAVATPTPSIMRKNDSGDEDDYDDELEQRAREQRRYYEEDQQYHYEHQNQAKHPALGQLADVLRGALSSRPGDHMDPSNHPLTYQEVQSTPSLSVIASPEPSAPPSPAARPRRISNAPASTRPQWQPPSPMHSRINHIPDNYIPPLDADGGFSLPPPHEMDGSAMASAINLNISQNPSRNPSRNPSPVRSVRNLPKQRSTAPSADVSRAQSREVSPAARRIASIGHSLKNAAGAVLGRNRSRSRSRSPIEEPASQPRSRPRSSGGVYIDVPQQGQGLLGPEYIQVRTPIEEVGEGASIRGRQPQGRRGAGTSQGSGRVSPVSQMSIYSMNGALGFSRGLQDRVDRDRDIGLVTYPTANRESAANLSMIEEERARSSQHWSSPSQAGDQRASIMQSMRDPHLFSPASHAGSTATMNRQRPFSVEDSKESWEPSSRYPPPPPVPIKSPNTLNRNQPWANRHYPTKLTVPPLLGPQSPSATSSKGGFAGVGAGGGMHRRAASTTALSGPPIDISFENRSRNFASPHQSVRLSMVGSLAGSESSRPPVAPKPAPPASRRSKLMMSPINLDDPTAEDSPYQHPGHAATRSWSGEQRHIGQSVPARSRAASNAAKPLVTVEERSPYLQNEAARSTGSINSVHSNRLKFNPQEYVDPSFLVASDLTAELEQQLDRFAPPPVQEGPSTSVTTKMGKRVSKVLKFGRKSK